MGHKPNRAEREIVAAVKSAGLECSVETRSKHRALYVEGKLAMVFSHGANAGNRDMGHVASIIRRAKEVKLAIA